MRRLILINSTMLCIFFSLLMNLFASVRAIHHMKLEPLQLVNRQDSNRPFRVTNYCPVDIYPAIETQAGTGPLFGGFHAVSGNTTNFTVSADWQGRIWARTNCSFNANGTGPDQPGGLDGTGKACLTGDCGGIISCKGTGQPATLAEFNLASNMSLSFYDISLVDGYNLPMAIVSLHNESSDPDLANVPSNTTNPVCIGSPNFLTPTGEINSTTVSVPVTVISGNITYNTPLEDALQMHAVSRWCPWTLQLQPPPKPGAGVYPYPDDNIARPDFDPCISSCSMHGHPSDCCTGSYDSASSCHPNLYSTAAKKVCPDAYSYAYDDESSTFAIKQGAGFEVVFCPSGRSTNIRKVLADPTQK